MMLSGVLGDPFPPPGYIKAYIEDTKVTYFARCALCGGKVGGEIKYPDGKFQPLETSEAITEVNRKLRDRHNCPELEPLPYDGRFGFISKAGNWLKSKLME